MFYWNSVHIKLLILQKKSFSDSNPWRIPLPPTFSDINYWKICMTSRLMTNNFSFGKNRLPWNSGRKSNQNYNQKQQVSYRSVLWKYLIITQCAFIYFKEKIFPVLNAAFYWTVLWQPCVFIYFWKITCLHIPYCAIY